MIVCEGVYSLDGDIAPITEIVALKKELNCLLMFDEAHSLGVLGAHGTGCDEMFGLAPDDIDVKMGTLSKAIPSVGGYVAGSKTLVDYLRFASGAFIFSAALPPAATAAAIEGFSVLERGPWRVERMQENAAFFLARAKSSGMDTLDAGGTPIIPVQVGDDERTFRAAAAMREAGDLVPPPGTRPPAGLCLCRARPRRARGSGRCTRADPHRRRRSLVAQGTSERSPRDQVRETGRAPPC